MLKVTTLHVNFDFLTFASTLPLHCIEKVYTLGLFLTIFKVKTTIRCKSTDGVQSLHFALVFG